MFAFTIKTNSVVLRMVVSVTPSESFSVVGRMSTHCTVMSASSEYTRTNVTELSVASSHLSSITSTSSEYLVSSMYMVRGVWSQRVPDPGTSMPCSLFADEAIVRSLDTTSSSRQHIDDNVSSRMSTAVNNLKPSPAY